MELSGNLWERAVTLGNGLGRAFTGLHGNGLLDAAGGADVTNWPGATAMGGGFHGGGYANPTTLVRVSDRNFAGLTNPNRSPDFGFRCVRTAP